MCVGVPGKVLSIDEPTDLAQVDVAGVTRKVLLSLLQGDERPVVGDYVLVYTGMALAKVDEQEALELQRMLEGEEGAYDDFSTSLRPRHDEERERSSAAVPAPEAP